MNFNIYNVVFKKKERKTPGDIIISHCVPKILMIWSTVLEIIECDRLKLVIMGHFSPFYHPLSSKPNKSEIWRNEEKKIAGDIIILHMCTKNTIIWGTVREIQSETDRIFCHLWSFFTPYNPQNQNFEKMKKVIAYVIILHMCTINHDHMIYASWDIRPDRIFCHFGPFFALWPS